MSKIDLSNLPEGWVRKSTNAAAIKVYNLMLWVFKHGIWALDDHRYNLAQGQADSLEEITHQPLIQAIGGDPWIKGKPTKQGSYWLMDGDKHWSSFAVDIYEDDGELYIAGDDLLTVREASITRYCPIIRPPAPEEVEE